MRFGRNLVICVSLAALLPWAGCKSKEEKAEADASTRPAAIAQAGDPAAIAVVTASTNATVESIDRANRMITIKMPDGSTQTYKVPVGVVNFDQMKAGDQVKARVVESLAVAVRKSSAPPSAKEAIGVVLAPQGAKPGMITAKTLELTAKVQAVDLDNRTLSIEGPAGRTRTFKVGPNVNLEGLKQGDDVVVRYTEALALLDQSPQISGTPVGPATQPAGAATQPAGAATQPSEKQDALALATDAYIYGYPLITMETTRRVMTNVAKAETPHAPMGQFANMREYPNASFKEVTAPNADTLYSAAWLDLSTEPYMLHIPDMGDRFYLMPMLDAWTNVFASPGKRTGVKEGDFAITGPGWKGELPENVKEIKAPTDMVWIIGRIYCTGKPEDYQAVHELQDKLALTPLSAWGKPYTPAEGKVDPMVDMKTPPREQVNRMDTKAFFSELAMLMKENPPAAADAPMVARMEQIGITPGQEFDASKLDSDALQAARETGLKKIAAAAEHTGKKVNGWQITFTGKYGTDYLFRSAVAMVGLGANLPEDACYPFAQADADGKPFDGANRYVWHFNSKGNLPPVNGFWSLTMYNPEMFFVENPLNRYTLSERNDLKPNADGSIDMYIQKDNPGPDKEANWLPAPEGGFVLMLRMYWPKEEFLKGTWAPPAVQRQAAIAGTPVGSQPEGR